MDVDNEIKRIEQRNRRVEAEKAWETSLFRSLTICVITYVITAIVFLMIGVKYYYLNALIPTTGFFLSTLSLRPIRNWWITHRMRKR